MAERVNVQVKIDRDVWEAFQSFVVETHGQKYGNLGREAENALSEYIDRDRYARIEERLDEIADHLDGFDGTHTRTPNGTAEWREWIAEKLGESGRTVIPDDDVRRVIERGPGADDRTVEKYKEQLKRHGLAYEHPTSGVWTLDRGQWMEWAGNHTENNPAIDVHDLIDPYPIDFDEFDRATTEVVEA